MTLVGTDVAPTEVALAGISKAPHTSEVRVTRIRPRDESTVRRLSKQKNARLTHCRPFPTACRDRNRACLNNVPVRKLGFLVVGVAAIVLSACSSTADTSIASDASVSEIIRPITISQKDVTAPAPFTDPWPATSAQRIVSLANGSGEVIVALGGARQIVGRDETSNAPEIVDAPIVTSGHEINAESVLALAPDLVLIDASSGPQEAIELIEGAGVPVVEVPEAWSLADIDPKVSAIGGAIGASVQAIDYVTALTSGTQELSLGSSPKVAFLYLRGTSAIYLLGGVGSGADSMISQAGGVDVGAQAQLGPFTPLTAEEIVELDPEVLLVMTKGLESVGGIDGLLQLPGIAQTRAAATRAVVAVDDTLLLSFGPRTGEVVIALHDAFSELIAP